MGFDALFFARLDYKDKEKRLNDKEMEYVWRPSSLGNDVNILTHVLYHHYSAPSGFDFDEVSNDTPWINNENSKDFNADQEAQKLMTILDDRAKHYLTDEILVLFGDDFRWMNAF